VFFLSVTHEQTRCPFCSQNHSIIKVGKDLRDHQAQPSTHHHRLLFKLISGFFNASRSWDERHKAQQRPYGSAPREPRPFFTAEGKSGEKNVASSRRACGTGRGDPGREVTHLLGHPLGRRWGRVGRPAPRREHRIRSGTF